MLKIKTVLVCSMIFLTATACGSSSGAESSTEESSSKTSTSSDRQSFTLELSGDVNESFSTDVVIVMGRGGNAMSMTANLDGSYSSQGPTFSIHLNKIEKGAIELAFGDDGHVRDGQISLSHDGYGYSLTEAGNLTITEVSDDWIVGTGENLVMKGKNNDDLLKGGGGTIRERAITISKLEFKIKRKRS